MSKRRAELTARARLGLIVSFLFLTVLSVGSVADAQDLRVDTSRIVLRPTPDAELAEYRTDERFIYSDEETRASSPLKGLFWQKVSEFLDRVFGSRLGQPLLWLIAIGIGLFAISLLLGTSPRSAFYRRSRSVAAAIEKEDLEITDFAALIASAISRGDFREAVRLRFIKILKELADRDWIKWTKEKTNRSYVTELTSGPSTHHLGKSFQTVAHWFDYCWYGDIVPDAQTFARIEQSFIGLENLLSTTPATALNAPAES